ncbi:YegP family protein [Halococcus sp. IIIV-5B]|uniref:YegP family protein n=1 Tax=Halococcus sp. IIIV-5B TaxID=2321230 RepID=UPI0013142F9E|nr:YegP family protein [Halococcus sp. IIIV-5B]
MTATFEYYEGSDRDYYWRLRESNGKIVADGSEGYSSESNVKRAIENVKQEVPNASVVEVNS